MVFMDGLGQRDEDRMIDEAGIAPVNMSSPFCELLHGFWDRRVSIHHIVNGSAEGIHGIEGFSLSFGQEKKRIVKIAPAGLGNLAAVFDNVHDSFSFNNLHLYRRSPSIVNHCPPNLVNHF
jgi:hypothetical protein